MNARNGLRHATVTAGRPPPRHAARENELQSLKRRQTDAMESGLAALRASLEEHSSALEARLGLSGTNSTILSARAPGLARALQRLTLRLVDGHRECDADLSTNWQIRCSQSSV